MTYLGSNSVCTSKPKSLGQHKTLAAVVVAVSIGQAVMFSPVAKALPQGHQVVEGSATVDVSARDMVINQNTDRAVIDYQSFNVASDERVQFIQPGSQSIALNRVIGNNLSQIAGQLDANGRIFLINPNGVLFGEGAQVNVGSLLVTTLNTSGFTGSGTYLLEGGSGTIENHGVINANDGVYLVAPELVNTGTITANEAALISGQSVLLQPEGSDIAILLDTPEAVNSLQHSGTIEAHRTLLAVGDGVEGNEIINDGIVRATAVAEVNGSIELIATGADAWHDGQWETQGGAVSIKAGRYAQTGSIDTSGPDGGGNVSIRTTETIAMHSSSHINASGINNADAGDVILFADNATAFVEGAQIDAQGGVLGGDGGFVEVSGKNTVLVNGAVNVGATVGEAGLFYIDPSNVVINDNGVNESAFVGTGPYTWDFGGAQDAQIDIDSILAALMNGDVIIDTASAEAFPGAMSIEVDIDFDGIPDGRTMSLSADTDITFQSGVDIHDSVGGDTNFNLVMNADGNIDFSDGTINTGTGTLTANAGGDIIVGSVTSANTSDTAINLISTGALIDDGNNGTNINADSGGVYLSAAGGIDSGLDFSASTTTIGISHTHASTFTFSSIPSVTLTGVTLGASSILNITSTNQIEFTGTTGAELDGASNSELNLNSTAGYVRFDAMLADTVGAVDNSTALTVTANSGVFFTDGAGFHAGDGLIDLQTNSGGATFTGLTSNNTANNAIYLNIDSGNSTDPGDTIAQDLSAPYGGITFDITDDAIGLDIQTDNLDATSTGGMLSLTEADDLNIVSLTAANGVALTVGGDLTIPTGATLLLPELTTNVTGGLIIPNAGISGISTSLDLTADDIITESSGRTLALNSGDITIATAASGGNLIVNSTANNLDLTNTGTNRLEVTDADDVTLTDVNFPSGVISVATPAGADLTIDGSIDLDGDNGTLELSTGQDMTLDVDLVDATGGIDNSSNITITSVGNIDFDPAATVNVGTGVLTINAGGQVDLGLLTGGTVSVTASTDILDDNGASNNIAATNITLNAGGSIALDTNELELSGGSVDVTSSGGGSHLVSSSALTLNSLNVAGDIQATVTAGDLTIVPQSPTLTGEAILAVNAGELVVNAAGLSISGDLHLTAEGFNDGDSAVFLVADDADITILNGANPVDLTVDFDQLILDSQTAQSVSITDIDSLILSDLSTQSNTTLASSGGEDLAFNDTTPTATGPLNLSAVGANIILPDTGLTIADDLNLTANNVIDSDTTVILGANGLALNLASTANSIYTTTVSSLTVADTGTGSVTINEADNLSLTDISSAADVTIDSAAGNITVVDPTLTVAGTLTLDNAGSGNVDATAAGVNTTGDLVINSTSVVTGGGPVTLGAADADVTLSAPTIFQWDTAVDALTMDLTTTSAVTVTDADGYTVNGFTTGGDATLTQAAGGGLFLANDLAVAGDLSLVTYGSGDLGLPVAGLTLAGNLTIDALDIASGLTTVALTANSADITLRVGNDNILWNTTVNSLTLDHTGLGSHTFNNSVPLTVAALAAEADVTITAAAGDITMTPTTADVLGTLALNTAGAGNLIVQDAGFTNSGNLAVDVANIADSDSTVSLGASAATLNVRDGAAASTLNLTANSLDIAHAGTGTLTVDNSGALTLAAAQAGGDLDITAAGDLTVAATTATIGGDLSLTTSGAGDLVLQDAGFAVAGNLSVDAANVVDSDSAVTLAANTAIINVRDGAAASTFNLTADFLDIVTAGAGALTANNSKDLTLTQIQSGGDATVNVTGDLAVAQAAPTLGGDLTLTATGDMTLPDTGLTAANGLTVLAANVVDTDGDITIDAAQLQLTTTNAADTADHTWALNTGSLDLNYAGTGTVSVTSTSPVVLAGAQAGGGLNITSVGDLTVTGTTATVGGAISLNTSGAGNLVLQDAGFSVVGDLNIDAANVVDSDSTVIVGADTTTINLRDGAVASTFDLTANSLDIATAGNGLLTVNNTQTLNLARVQSGGDAAVNVTGDLTLAEAAPAVGGDLTLSATGNIVVPDAGFTASNSLTLSASEVVDSDTNVTLAASEATLNITGGSGATAWSTTFDQLDLTVAGMGNVTVNNTQDLLLNNLNINGDATVSAAGDLTVVQATPSVAGSMTLGATGNVVVPDAGLTVAGALGISAAELVDSDSDIAINADSAVINLTGGAANATWTTLLNQLDVTRAGTGSITVANGQALTLNNLDAGGDATVNNTGNLTVTQATSNVAGNLIFNTTGNLILPDAGFTVSNDLTVSAVEITDSDADVTFAAGVATINVTGGAGDAVWSTTFDQLDLTRAGTGSVAVNNSQDLLLNNLNTGGDAAVTAAGNLTVAQATPAVAGNLTLGATGSLIVPDAGLAVTNGLTVSAANVVDTDGDITLDSAQLQLTTTNAADTADHTWALNTGSLDLNYAGTGTVSVTSTSPVVLAGAQAGGGLNITSVGDLTVTGTTATVGGTLSLNTSGANNLVLQDAGFGVAGDLTIDAANVVDSDTAVILGADTATINLRDGTAASIFDLTANILDIATVGNGLLTVNNTQNLNLARLQSGNDAAVNVTGDLTLAEATPAVGGDLTVSATGNIVVPDAGFTAPNSLTLSASEVVDSDTNVTLAASDATINITGGAAPATWTTLFDQMDLTRAGTGHITVNNGQNLVVSGLVTGGDATINIVGNGTFTESNPTVGGTLAANAAGNMVVSDAGLNLANDLILNAVSLMDSDNTVALSADAATVTLSALAAPTRFNTQVNSLVLDVTGNTLNVVQNGALSLDGLTVSDVFDLTVNGGNLSLGTNTLNTTADVSLTSAQALTLANGGLSTGANLALQGTQIIETGSSTASVTADALSWMETTAAAINITGSVNSLDLNGAMASSVDLSNDKALNITGWSTPQISSATLNVLGELQLLENGLSALNSLIINAADVVDSDRTITLNTADLVINATAPAGNITWDGVANNADITMGSSGDFLHNQTGDLTLIDLNNDGQALSVADGNATIQVQDGDLAIEGDVTVTDATADGTRTAIIDFGVTNGNMGIGETTDVVVHSQNTQDPAPPGTFAPGIILEILGTEADDRTLTLGSDTTTAQLIAEGSDLFINARADGTPDSAGREVVQNTDSTINAYNSPSDAGTGTFEVNGVVVSAPEGVFVGEGHEIEVVAEFALPPPLEEPSDNILEEVEEVEQVQEPVTEDNETGPEVSAQFVKVFGQCDKANEEDKKRCRIESALKAFLSHWLVGGEMPPRTEI